MRWLLIVFTVLALMLSACGKIGGGEKIAVVNWDKVLQEHPQHSRLQKLKEEYSLLLDKRREQEIIGKTRMSNLAKLYQLKQNSRQSFFSADFMTRMMEKQTAEQEKLKQLSNQIADEIDREKVEAELKAVQAERDSDRMLLMQHKFGLVNQRMEPHVKAMQQRLDAYALQLQTQMRAEMKKDSGKDDVALQKVPAALKELLGTVDEELDKQQQAIETMETAIKKDMESVVAKLAKERGYSVVFHKYRTNVSADDITEDVIAGLKKLELRTKAAEALNKKAAGAPMGDKSK